MTSIETARRMVGRPAPKKSRPAMRFAMSDDAVHTRRWLLNASGAALLSRGLAIEVAGPQTAQPASAESGEPVPSATAMLSDYVVGALDRELPADVVLCTKLHLLDTFAAMVSGSRLKPGELAARYVDSLGGK